MEVPVFSFKRSKDKGTETAEVVHWLTEEKLRQQEIQEKKNPEFAAMSPAERSLYLTRLSYLQVC